MADLQFTVAQNLIGFLLGIGHPYQEKAVNATALLLIKWCKGGIFDEKRWSPEMQAQALVEEAAETWDGWPEKGGARQLRELFLAKFGRKETQVLDLSLEDRLALERRNIEAMISRGALAARCRLCDPDARFCEYGGERAHARYAAEIAGRGDSPAPATLPPARPAPQTRPLVKPPNYDEMERRAQNVYADEQRRKQQQLERVEQRGW